MLCMPRNHPTRRLLLQATLLLPVSGSLTRAAHAKSTPHLWRFTTTPAPQPSDVLGLSSMHTRSHLERLASDGHRVLERRALTYTPFFVTGQWVPDGKGSRVVAGGCFDIHNQPILDRSVPGQERPYFSDCPDGMSLIRLPGIKAKGVKGHTVFAVVQFEYTSRNLVGKSPPGGLPSPMAVLTIDQHPQTGQLKLVRYHNVDTSGVRGLWTTCGASLSPWNTHLSSEEYEPDAASPPTAYFKGFSTHLFGDPNRAKPYDYGHLPEVTVLPDGTGRIRKHYCLGRISHELVQVMPDERTVLMGDDWTNGGAFMFIADKPRDLSAGMLYVARWHQTSGQGPGSARLSWIRLGHAKSDAIRNLVDGGIRCEDIMDVRTTDPKDSSFTRIPYNGKTNWVRLKPGMEQAAAFLETHRYAALMGGSLGFTKWEGTTLNARDKKAYIAMSRIEASMLNGSGGILVQGPYSGAVYEQNLSSGQADSRGQIIASEWVPMDMAAVPELVARDYGDRPRTVQDDVGNFADPQRIACPDNLKFSEKLRTLFIGEDSNTHVNNFLWAFNVDTRELVRILCTPVGAESTGLHAVDEVNGFTYILSNFQHPGGWDKPLHDKVRASVEPVINRLYSNRYGAMVGYLSAGLRAQTPETGMPQTARDEPRPASCKSALCPK